MTIAKQLKVTEFPFIIKDSQGRIIYSEYSDGCWAKREYDSQGNKIYIEDSTGYWTKYEYDSKGKEIYCVNSRGYIEDNRPKTVPEYTMEELTKLIGKEFKIKK